MVEGIPFVVQVLAAVLSPPAEYSIAYVIERLSSSSKLTFITEQGTFVDEDRILGALELAFKSITKECYKCSQLLVRYVGIFSENVAKHIITKEMIRQFADADFRIEKCLRELSITSLLETRYHNVKTYRFHTIVRSFLENKKVDNMQLLKMFWIQRCKFYSLWRASWLSEEDVQMLTGLMRTEEYLKYVVHLLSGESSIDASNRDEHIMCIYTLKSGSTEAKKLTANTFFICVRCELCHSSNFFEYTYAFFKLECNIC